MKLDQIVLYVLGNGNGDARIGAEALEEEISRCIASVCATGSSYAACYATFDGKQSFESSVAVAVNNVRADEHLVVFGINAISIHCIFVVNNTLTAEQWKSCFEQTRNAVTPLAQNVSYYAVVQKDSITPWDDMAGILARSNMAVYCFQQQTQNGHIIRSETDEKQLLAYYALLAGAGQLDGSVGIYTGSFNKLSLMADDFRRIRNHYALCGVTSPEKADEGIDDKLFGAFFGGWLNGGVSMAAGSKLLCGVMSQKAKSYFPGPEELAILGNKDHAVTTANVERFIEMNFESERFERFMGRMTALEGKIQGKTGLVQQWSEYFDATMRKNVSFYCEDAVKYIRERLVDWLRRCAKEIERDSLAAKVDVSSAGGKDFVADAIMQAEQMMRPYIDRASARVIGAIADCAETKAAQMIGRISRRDQVLEKKKWILDENDMTYFKHYAENIISVIETYCRANNMPQSEMDAAENYYGEGDIARAWEKLVDELSDRIFKQVRDTQDLIAALAAMDAAEFNRQIPALLQDRGLRIFFGNTQVMPAAGIPKTIYIHSAQLNVGVNGKNFPDAEMGNCVRFETEGLDNVLQFRVVRLMLQGNSADSEAAGRESLLKALGASQRFIRQAAKRKDAGDELSRSVYAAGQNEAVPKQDEFSVQCIGQTLNVRLPGGMGGTIDYEISGYSREGTKTTPRTGHPSIGTTVNLSIPLQGLYGRCELKLKRGAEIVYQCKFDGPKTEAAEYEVVRPKLMNKSRNVQSMEKEFKAEHVVFRLLDKNDSVEACINPSGSNSPDAIRYPIGSGKEWHVWAGESVASSMRLEACDKAGVRKLEEK